DNFGPWMLVDKKNNKARGNGVRAANQKVQDDKINSRFNTLDTQNTSGGGNGFTGQGDCSMNKNKNNNFWTVVSG
ncbi:hypothetical protein MKX03_004529, partial [Papaver bracteatum]